MFPSYLWACNAHVLNKWTTFVFSLTCVCSHCILIYIWVTFMCSFILVCLQCACAVYLRIIILVFHLYFCGCSMRVCCILLSTAALIPGRFVFCRLRNLCYWAAMSTLAHLVHLLLHKNLHNCFLNKRKLVHVFGFEPIFLATCFWFFLLFFDFLWCLGISVFQGLTIKVYFHFLPWLLPYGCRVYV